MYADDTKLLGTLDSPEACARLQDDLDKCVEWARKWLMTFSIEKCKVMHVGQGENKSAHTYTMEDTGGKHVALQVITEERDLGVLVSDTLSLSAQCKAASNRANWKFGELK